MKPIKPPKQPHLRSLLGRRGVHSVTMRPTKGEKTTESKKAHPKPMRRREPTNPTMTARRHPPSKPKSNNSIDIVFTIWRKDKQLIS